jgi:hypothetical protein
MTIEETIRELEERLLSPEIRASAPDLRRLISDLFVEIGTSGRIYTKASIINVLTTTPELAGVGMEYFRVLEIAPGVALATYRCGGTVRSSLWRQEGTAWRVVFHQGTRTALTAELR